MTAPQATWMQEVVLEDLSGRYICSVSVPMRCDEGGAPQLAPQAARSVPDCRSACSSAPVEGPSSHGTKVTSQCSIDLSCPPPPAASVASRSATSVCAPPPSAAPVACRSASSVCAPPPCPAPCPQESVASKHAARLPKMVKDVEEMTANVSMTANQLQHAYDSYRDDFRRQMQRCDAVMNRLKTIDYTLRHLGEVEYDPRPATDPSRCNPLQQWRTTKPTKVEYRHEERDLWGRPCPAYPPPPSHQLDDDDDDECGTTDYVLPPEKKLPQLEEIHPTGLDAVTIQRKPLLDLACRLKSWQCK
ncbi:uncharacterized protein LOC134541578 [Bacillus rossius redtenbacheri]|uniref:uncharacterized protein LOC134541578 n=1 Tax=Bacillus rossius redtenbacheri TaxID=93214 RepID=UPI002FDDA402